MNQSLNNAYTDAPQIHPNLILGSLQLLFWILFHPSAWRNHITRIDLSLPPTFCLVELSKSQWHNSALRRLLVMGYLILPVSFGFPLSIFIAALFTSDQDIIVSSAGYGLAASIAGILTIGVVVNVASSIAVGVGASVILSLATAIALTTNDNDIAALTFIIAVSIIMGLVGGLTGTQQTQKPIYALDRLITGILIGLLIGGVVFAVPIILGNRVLGDIASGRVPDVTNSLLTGILISSVPGFALGSAVGWRRHHLKTAIVCGIVVGVIFLLASTIGYSTPNQIIAFIGKGVGGAIWVCSLFGLLYLLTSYLAGPQSGLIASALGSGLGYTAYRIIIDSSQGLWFLSIGLFSLLVGLTLIWWRPILLWPFILVWNTLLFYADKRQPAEHLSLLRINAAFWDEFQHLPLFGLDGHLVLVAQRNPIERQAAVNYLATTHQRWAAQAAQIELYARQLEDCANIEDVGQVHNNVSSGKLTGPINKLLQIFNTYSHDVQAALNQTNNYHQRVALGVIEKQLDNLQRELTLSNESYAARFYPAASQWHQVVVDYRQTLIKAAELNKEIENPYIFGIPLTEQQEIFVGRTDIVARIEQFLLDEQRPPLLLYGQRRMGKTSLLHNLRRLLRSAIIPLFVDGEAISGANDYPDFLFNITKQMSRSARAFNLTLPRLSQETMKASPFTCFNEWLDAVEQVLETEGHKIALLALDEFEALNSVINKGRFDEHDVLRMLRHLIQHRPRFKLLLAGSHTLEEFKHWAGYLINTQVLEISYLEQQEARQLIEQPIKEFKLNYDPEAGLRVLSLTRGHPYLVQLLCYQIVTLKNKQSPTMRQLARFEDVETAVPLALQLGSFFFTDIEQNQIDEHGRNLLRFLASLGERAIVNREILLSHLSSPENLDDVLTSLVRRDLIEETNGGYRFQVELTRRWFTQQ